MENKSHVFEDCVLCNTSTDIPTITPIELREGYISGIGQLCPECASRYGVMNGDNMEGLI